MYSHCAAVSLCLQLADMEREKNRFAEHAVAMERRSQTAEEENRRVRDENNRLKDELAFLRETVSCKLVTCAMPPYLIRHCLSLL